MAEEAKHHHPAESADRGFFDLPDFGALFRSFGHWCRANPLAAAMLALLLGLLVHYYFFTKAFLSLSQTPAHWLYASWNPENDQQHCVAVFPLAILLVLLRWRDLQAAPKQPSNAGLFWVVLGVLALVAGIRCVEGRYPVVALTLLSYGSAMFLFGRKVARIVLFPCVFLLFMMPVGGIVQGTAGLQSATANIIQTTGNLVGIPVQANGATLIFTDGKSEPLEVAGGCSGIRSLMAMTMLAALYAYFVMRTPWRGLALFACSLFFALIGNFARVFTVVLVARFIGPQAAHSYHDWSGLVFFPVAVLAMVGVGNLLNRDWFRLPARPARPTPTLPDPEPTAPPARYDY